MKKRAEKKRQRLTPLPFLSPDRLGQIGVAHLLATEGRAGAVARDKDDFVTQRQQGLGDRLDQSGVIPTGEVGTADAAGKQHIANPGEPLGLAEQHDMARV